MVGDMKATHLILAAVLVMAAFFSGCGGADDIKHKCVECKNMVNAGATRCEHCGGNPYKGQHKDQALVEEAFNQALENQREGKLESSDETDWFGFWIPLGLFALVGLSLVANILFD